jgi:hypothetical protein
VALAGAPEDERPRRTIERAFGRSAAAVERDWRDYLGSLSAA